MTTTYEGNQAYSDGRADYLYPSELRSLANCPYEKGTFDYRCYLAGRNDAADQLAAGGIKLDRY